MYGDIYIFVFHILQVYKKWPNFVTIHGIDFYQHLHVYAPNVYPLIMCMSNSKRSFGSQLSTRARIFHIHMSLGQDGAPPPCFVGSHEVYAIS